MYILTTYYTKHLDPQRKIMTSPDDFDKMKLPMSVSKNTGYHCIVLHDGLSHQFIDDFKRRWPNVSFLLVDATDNVGLNDVRYKHYAQVIASYKLDHVVMADCFDATVNRYLNPNEFSETKLLASVEYQTATGPCLWNEKTPAGRWCIALAKSCIGGSVDHLYNQPIINAGVIMAHKEQALEFCSRMYHFAKSFRYPDVSMFAANIVVRLMQKESPNDVAYFGDPFVSPFKEWDYSSKYFISHK